MENINDQITDTITKTIDQVKGIFSTSNGDIISIIKEDHKPLKELIKVMQDADRPVSERFEAFKEFAPLLMTHSKAEEKSLYDFMKTKPGLKEFAFEGDTEHGLADQLTEEANRITNPDQLGAKIKVLAELVQHHIQEEESDILPAVQAKLEEKTLMELSKKYTAVQSQIISEGQDDSPHETDLTTEDLAH